MREEYKKELADLKAKMLTAEAFAKKLPLFEDVIIKNKLSGKENFFKYCNRYKETYLPWELSRGFYKEGGRNCTITNHPTKDYEGYFFSLYINTLSMYNRHEDYGIYEALSDVDVFFIDHLNTTFYITDENIEQFLDAINDWYLSAREKAKQQNAREVIEKKKQELAAAEKIISGAS